MGARAQRLPARAASLPPRSLSLCVWQVRGRKGYLLVLGSANVDEALRGYMTK